MHDAKPDGQERNASFSSETTSSSAACSFVSNCADYQRIQNSSVHHPNAGEQDRKEMGHGEATSPRSAFSTSPAAKIEAPSTVDINGEAEDVDGLWPEVNSWGALHERTFTGKRHSFNHGFLSTLVRHVAEYVTAMMGINTEKIFSPMLVIPSTVLWNQLPRDRGPEFGPE